MPRPSTNHQWLHNKAALPVVEVVIDPHLTQYLRPHQRDGLLFLYECVMGLRYLSVNIRGMSFISFWTVYGSKVFSGFQVATVPFWLMRWAWERLFRVWRCHGLCLNRDPMEGSRLLSASSWLRLEAWCRTGKQSLTSGWAVRESAFSLWIRFGKKGKKSSNQLIY